MARKVYSLIFIPVRLLIILLFKLHTTHFISRKELEIFLSPKPPMKIVILQKSLTFIKGRN